MFWMFWVKWGVSRLSGLRAAPSAAEGSVGWVGGGVCPAPLLTRIGREPGVYLIAVIEEGHFAWRKVVAPAHEGQLPSKLDVARR